MNESIEERIKRFTQAFNRTLENYEEDHPEWREEVITWLAELGLSKLRKFVEAKGQEKERWGSPYIDFNYPVEIDWDQWTKDRSMSFQPLTIPNTSLNDDGSAVKAFAEAMVRKITLDALTEFTRGAVLEKRGEAVCVFMSREDGDIFALLKDESEKQIFLKRLSHPFSLGAGVFTIDDDSCSSDGRRLSADETKEFGALWELVKPPLVSDTLNIDGNLLEMRIILQIHPLTIDLRDRKAYFCITTGIFLQPLNSKKEPLATFPPWSNPANWKLPDQEEFWANLLNRIRARIPTEAEEIVEAVVSFHSTLKIRVKKSDLNVQPPSNQILAALQSAGTVQEFSVQENKISPELIGNLKLLQQVVENAKAAADKGRALENLISALFQTVPGFAVRTNIRTATEEIDIAITNDSQHPVFRDEGPRIIAECKNWTKKCGREEFSLFRAKIENRKRRARLGFIISWNGFAGTVTSEMLRGSTSETLVVPITGEDVRKSVRAGTFLPVLVQAWNEAVDL